MLTGPKPKEIIVKTFRISYLVRSPKVEKLGFEPVRMFRVSHEGLKQSNGVSRIAPA